MTAASSQTWDPFERRFRLLLVLTDRGDGGAWQKADDLVLTRVAGYHELTQEQAEQQWSTDGRWRYTLRKKLKDDVDLLRKLGFDIQLQQRAPTATSVGLGAAKSNKVSWYRLRPAPLVPVPLAKADVPKLVQLVAAQRASRVQLPKAALDFSRARDAGRQVRCTDGEHIVEGDPVHLVLRATGAWLGVVRLERGDRVLTVRLGARYEVEVLDSPASTTSLPSPGRALDPMTWGSGAEETLRVLVQGRAVGRALDVLGAAVQSHRPVADQGVELDLRVTDRRLLLARLVALRTTVTLADPQWRATLRIHLQPLASPATWAPPVAPTGLIASEGDDEEVPDASWSQRPVSGLELLEGPDGKGQDLIGMTLLALTLLDVEGRITAEDLAARLKTSVATLDEALTRYNAAETDVVAEHPSLYYLIDPLVLHRDPAGGLLSMEHPSPGRPRTPALGRLLVEPQVVLAACAFAARQLAAGKTDSSIDLAGFVSRAQDALGLHFTAEGTSAQAAQGSKDVDLLVADIATQVEQALNKTRRGLYKSQSAASPAAPGLAVGGRPLHRLDYENPWTAELTSRVCVLLGLRRHGTLRLLDVLDVGAVTSPEAVAPSASGPTAVAPAVRTLVVSHIRELELVRGHNYPLGDHEHEQYARSAAEVVLTRVALRPGSGSGPAATVRRGWRGTLLQDTGSGQEYAEVTLHPPAAERALDLLATWPDDLQVVSPSAIAAAVRQRAQELLQHHT